MDGEDPTKITQAAFATVIATVTPKPRNPEPEVPNKKTDKDEEVSDDDDEEDASVEV